MRPFDPAASAVTSSSDCSPAVETRAANTTSASLALDRTSSTVTSLRKVMGVWLTAKTLSTVDAPATSHCDNGAMPTGARLARTSDVDDIAALQVRAWQLSFRDLLAPETLNALDAGTLAPQWAAAILTPPSPRHQVLVAIDSESGSDAVVGYAAIGPDDDPDADATTGQIFDLLIDPAHLGAGHGSRLMTAAVDHLRSNGATAATTWILLDDPLRRAFFESAGWGPDGAFRDLEVDGRAVRQIRLVTDCTTAG